MTHLQRRAPFVVAFALAPLLAGCGGFFRGDASSNEVERNAEEVEMKAREGHTRTGLAKLEESLGAFIKAERRIPEKLEELVPKYIAGIPTVELTAHSETSRVRVYPTSVLRDGHVDGTRIKHSGGWGYVFNDRQVVVFIDCTHKASSGRAWYLERGTF